LADRIDDIEDFQNPEREYDRDHKYEIMHRFISGFIFPNVKGFSSKILITDYLDFEEDIYRKAVKFLNEQNFISITKSGRLIE
jgi:hypothetical protein